MCCMHQHDHEEGDRRPGHADPGHAPWFRRPSRVALLASLATVVAYFLWTDHRTHVIAFLPYALLLLCPLMHLMRHGGHKHQGPDKRQ